MEEDKQEGGSPFKGGGLAGLGGCPLLCPFPDGMMWKESGWSRGSRLPVHSPKMGSSIQEGWFGRTGGGFLLSCFPSRMGTSVYGMAWKDSDRSGVSSPLPPLKDEDLKGGWLGRTGGVFSVFPPPSVWGPPSRWDVRMTSCPPPQDWDLSPGGMGWKDLLGGLNLFPLPGLSTSLPSLLQSYPHLLGSKPR